MPRKVEDAMAERLDLLTLAGQAGANMAELCRRFGVSRKTGYKWLKRFAERGAAGLEDRSRQPKVWPLRTAAAVEAAVLDVRRANPVWGGRKSRWILQRDVEAGSAVPAASTTPGSCGVVGRWSGKRRRPCRSSGSEPKPPTACGKWISRVTSRSTDGPTGRASAVFP